MCFETNAEENRHDYHWSSAASAAKIHGKMMTMLRNMPFQNMFLVPQKGLKIQKDVGKTEHIGHVIEIKMQCRIPIFTAKH